MDVLIVKIEWKWPLGEHGGSRDVQGFDKGMKWRKLGEKGVKSEWN